MLISDVPIPNCFLLHSSLQNVKHILHLVDKQDHQFLEEWSDRKLLLKSRVEQSCRMVLQLLLKLFRSCRVSVREMMRPQIRSCCRSRSVNKSRAQRLSSEWVHELCLLSDGCGCSCRERRRWNLLGFANLGVALGELKPDRLRQVGVKANSLLKVLFCWFRACSRAECNEANRRGCFSIFAGYFEQRAFVSLVGSEQ